MGKEILHSGIHSDRICPRLTGSYICLMWFHADEDLELLNAKEAARRQKARESLQPQSGVKRGNEGKEICASS